MKKVLLAAALLLSGWRLAGQGPSWGLVYAISAGEAFELYAPENAEPLDYLHTLVDTFRRDEPAVLPPGHYLKAWAEGQDLMVELHSVHSFHVQLASNRRDFVLQVMDAESRPLADAKVWLEKKEVPYDPGSRAFLLRKCRREGVVRVEAGKETAFFQLMDTKGQSLAKQRIQRFAASAAGRILSSPARLARRVLWKLKGGRGRLFPLKDKSFKGYIALSQPMYRPGDTLRVKAYIAKPNGRPLRRPMDFFLKEGRGQVLHRAGLQPEEPGTFTYSLPLGDTLRLDRDYGVQVLEQQARRRPPRGMGLGFVLADYELDEVSFSLRPERDQFQPADTVRLLASARGANGLPLGGGQLSLVLESVRAGDFRGEEVWVPDTLWQHEQALVPLRETAIAVPASVWPPAGIQARATAWFTAPGGELHRHTASFYRESPGGKFQLQLNEAWVEGKFIRDGQPDTATAVLRVSTSSGALLSEARVALPFRQRLNPLAGAYELLGGGRYAALPVQAGEAGLQFSGTNEKDTVAFRIINPRRLPVSWVVYRRQQEAARGWTADSLLEWSAPNSAAAPCRLKLQYTWAGKVQEEELELPAYKKMLAIEVTQPRRVAPGQAAPAKVKVLDYKGRPAPGANLVAGAIRAQFETGKNYIPPEIRYRKPRRALQYNDYQLVPCRFTPARRTITGEWGRRFGLDSMLFYRLRHPPGGVLLAYDTLAADSFYQTVAQFAPYIVRAGREQTVVLAYCNRKLAYYSGAGLSRPYSFAAPEGLNTLILRTREYEYTIKDVLLFNGQKLELSIDEGRYQESEWAGRISRRKVDPFFSYQELALLRNSILEVKSLPGRSEVYLWQDSTAISGGATPGSYRGRALKFGPFDRSRPVRYLQRGDFEAEVAFEPGFAYQIAETRDRLYESKTFDPTSKHKIFPETPIPVHRPGQLILHPRQVKRAPALRARLQPATPGPAADEPQGRYFPDYAPENTDELLLAALLVRGDSLVYSISRPGRMEIQLPAGRYRLYAFRGDGRVHQRAVEVRRDTLLYQSLAGAPFLPNTNRQLLQRFFFDKPLPADADLMDVFGLSGKAAQEQGRKQLIYGRVADLETGEPILFGSVAAYQNGVLVTGTETDFDGNFQLWVPPGPTDLEVSYVGYQKQRVRIHTLYGQAVDVRLDPSGVVLSEVMVTGYRMPAYRSDPATAALRLGRETDDDPSGQVLTEMPDSLPAGGWSAYSGLRSDFRDYAYWQPSLLTNKNGEAYFTARFPGDLTNWQSFAIGMDRRQRAGLATGRIQSYKPLAAQLYLPRFLLEGDRARLLGQVVNYTADSLAARTYFRQGAQLLRENNRRIGETLAETVAVEAPAGADSLAFTYALEMEGYTDGEERRIPVFPIGAPESRGHFAMLEGDTTLEWPFRAEYGPVRLYAREGMLRAFLSDIQYLKEYPYGCNEQTASRLLALLLEKDIKEKLGQAWAGAPGILETMGKLQRAQNPDGSWGWWPAGSANLWMSVYVLKALARAAEAGYPSPAFEKGMRYLTNRLAELPPRQQLPALEVMAAAGQNAAYEQLVAPLDTLPLSEPERLLAMAIRQQRGLPYSLDSLFAYRKTTAMGNSYWGDIRPGWQDNSLLASLLAYAILERADREAELPPIRRFLLERRRPEHGGWGNTFETARVLSVLLPGLLAEAGGEEWNNRLWVNGQERAFAGGALSLELSPEQPLLIRKAGRQEVYLTAWQSFFNRQPESRGGLFDIQTSLWQQGQPTDSLQAGIPAQLKARLRVDAAADYVMLEIPVPAGCSYYQEGGYRSAPEAHREYFRHKTAIFCEALAPGIYEFAIALEPRFSGRYTLNPAQASLMYYPAFFGREEVKVVEIGE
ncbi:MAG: carboxypeptidase-like regulatory domain-containing protein [Lewinellaceae bacterium]|nr:carboxypeptidase-like regulatory domain-containing protein [Lewinellaceae bacterium]